MRTLGMLVPALFLAILFAALTTLAHEDGHHHDDGDHQNETGKETGESPADILIELYRSKIKEDPGDYYNYTKLGASYIQKGREAGGIKPYLQAREALMKSLELYPDGYAAYIYLGQVSSYTHDFRKTIEYAKKAIELKPEKSVSYGVLGDAYMELGMYEEAAKAYETASIISPGFYSWSRIAQMKDLTGDTEVAIEIMKDAIDLALRDNLPGENRAWANVMLGSFYHKTGDLEKAEKSYQEALRSFKDHYLALEHLAEVQAARGSYREAARLYERALQINPKPHFYIELGKIYEKLGRPEKSEKLYREAEERYKDYAESGIRGHSRELVLFYTDRNINLDKALELARRDSEGTADIYACDTLAWAYYKAGDLDKAMEAMNKALRLGTRDALLYYHAGMIHYKIGNREEAKRYFDLVLETNPNFDKDAVSEVRYALRELDKSSS
ncbi:MAG: tetratricopeptide repeat protein [Thermodesulfobacteriota bacterium]